MILAGVLVSYAATFAALWRVYRASRPSWCQPVRAPKVVQGWEV